MTKQTPISVTINKGSEVIQHDYVTTLSNDEFKQLMFEEWMLSGDDEVTVETITCTA